MNAADQRILNELVNVLGAESTAAQNYISFCRSHITDSCICDWHHILPQNEFPAFKKALWNLAPLSPENHAQAHRLLLLSLKEKSASEVKQIKTTIYLYSKQLVALRRPQQSFPGINTSEHLRRAVNLYLEENGRAQ